MNGRDNQRKKQKKKEKRKERLFGFWNGVEFLCLRELWNVLARDDEERERARESERERARESERVMALQQDF